MTSRPLHSPEKISRNLAILLVTSLLTAGFALSRLAGLTVWLLNHHDQAPAALTAFASLTQFTTTCPAAPPLAAALLQSAHILATLGLWLALLVGLLFIFIGYFTTGWHYPHFYEPLPSVALAQLLAVSCFLFIGPLFATLCAAPGTP